MFLRETVLLVFFVAGELPDWLLASSSSSSIRLLCESVKQPRVSNFCDVFFFAAVRIGEMHEPSLSLIFSWLNVRDIGVMGWLGENPRMADPFSLRLC